MIGLSAKVRDACVLLGSAVVVVMGASVARRPASAAAPVASASAASAGEPPPLPSGAAPRGLEEVPGDDERGAGCNFKDRGFGDYREWKKLANAGGARVLVPLGRGVDGDGAFRLLVHFHGAEAVRKELAPEGFDLVIAAVDAGVGSGAYDRAFADPASFAQLVTAAEAEVAAQNGLPAAHASQIILSSWSAGYGAVTQVLSRPHERVEAVVLLDSLYAGYANGKHTMEHGQIPLFVEAARAAQKGGALLYLTHTDIRTPGYASTKEVASYLLGELELKPTSVDDPGSTDPFPLRRLAEEGRLTIRGYGGDGRDAHCAQLHLLPTVLRDTVLPAL